MGPGIQDRVLDARREAQAWVTAHDGDCPRGTDLGPAGLDARGLGMEIICGGSADYVIVRAYGDDGIPGTDDDMYSTDLGSGGKALDKIGTARVIAHALASQAVERKRRHACPTTIDPWGEAMVGSCLRSGSTITSAGPDRKHGTEDDITARVDVDL